MGNSRALVLFSGGQDSTTTLAWALDRFDAVETIGFDYGQRHRIEMECRETIRAKLPALSARYAERLGERCLNAPQQWFNFYPFWNAHD